jgi:hypothetical protein
MYPSKIERSADESRQYRRRRLAAWASRRRRARDLWEFMSGTEAADGVGTKAFVQTNPVRGFEESDFIAPGQQLPPGTAFASEVIKSLVVPEPKRDVPMVVTRVPVVSLDCHKI